jgi:hypothetical protein
LGGALGCLLAIGFHGQSSAQPKSDSPEAARAVEARSRETNLSLLRALIAKRAEIERTTASAQDKRATLYFLDRRIAEVKSLVE